MIVFRNPDELKAAMDRSTFRFLPEYGPAAFVCSHCNLTKPLQMDGGGTGYGLDNAQQFICYQCCAFDDQAFMTLHGKHTLYLTRTSNSLSNIFGDAEITNWPGTLCFKGRYKRGHHNVARYRYDVWFRGPDGHDWHGVTYGDNTQICHCKQIKRRTGSGNR